MIKLEDINIVFDRPLFVHQNIEIKDHCLTLIAGESGCGKTTLLYQIGLINYSEKNAKYWNLLTSKNIIQRRTEKQRTQLQHYQ